MIDKLKELTEYLGRDYGEDLWSDFAIDGARDLVNQLGVEQWNKLATDWINHESKWQVRLAETLFACESPRALDLLVAMLQSKRTDVAVAAAESLESSDDVWVPNSSMRDLLQDLQNRVTEENKYVFALLLARIAD